MNRLTNITLVRGLPDYMITKIDVAFAMLRSLRNQFGRWELRIFRTCLITSELLTYLHKSVIYSVIYHYELGRITNNKKKKVSSQVFPLVWL